MDESIWESKDTMRATYPSLFNEEGTLFSHLIMKMIVAYACDSICVCEFRDEIILREECKTWKK